jgi:transposase
MDTRFALMEDDKEKLVDEILRLRQEVEKLRLENEALKKKTDEKARKAADKKLNFLKDRGHRGLPPHRWGQKPGHPGFTRAKPDHVDREVVQKLSACPDCHHALSHPVATTEHVQEDIVPAHVEVTRFLHNRYWCPGCGKVVTAPHAPDEVPYGYIGPRALATMVWLKFHLALPGNKIKALLEDFCGLAVSEGAVHKALQRLADHLGLESDRVAQAVREAPAKHADETGWTVNGAGHWLWSFVTRRWAYVKIDKSRGSKVPKDILGHPFKGILISDFFSAYNKMSGQKQKCLVHLKREVRKTREAFAHGPPGDFKDPDKRLKRLLADADRLADRRTHLSALLYTRRVRRLKDRLFDFATTAYSHKFWQRLSARLLKHHQAIFTFLDVPGLPSGNNAAERSIKPHVIIRNRSYQNRTDAGANAHGVLSSILQTLLLQGRPVVQELAAAYPLHRQGIDKPLLFTSIR